MTNKKVLSIAAGAALAAVLMGQSGLASAALGCLKQEGLGLINVNDAKIRSCSDGTGTGTAQLTNIVSNVKVYRIGANLKQTGILSARMELLDQFGNNLGCLIHDNDANNASIAQANCGFTNSNPARVFKFSVGDGQGN